MAAKRPQKHHSVNTGSYYTYGNVAHELQPSYPSYPAQEQEETTLSMVWQEEWERYLETCLFQEEQELILLLGRELGTLDLEEQVRALQHCLDQWRQHIEGLECQKEPHGRLCRGVGVSVGVFLAILLL